MNFYKFLSVYLKSFTNKKFFYSFGGIDNLIQQIFKSQKKGIYIDIGCGHPIKNNNTYLLNKKGWSGINIDLDIDNIELFKIYRPKDLNICAAISDEMKETDLFFYHSRSALNTIDKKTANYQKAKVTSIKKITTTTLNNVLGESIYNSSNIDFLSIDVEGSELSVLKNFNFHKFKPKVIVVEYLDLSLNKLEIKNLSIQNAMNSEIYKLIISKNYTLANMIHSDLVFIYNDFRD
tara:strand:- start:50 stop:754 length:705 start_codon:yes stop_codon:yes gene_type:complete